MLPIREHGIVNPTAPTLLFSHFFGSSHREWQHIIDILAPSYRCFTIDAPGFGDAREIPGYTVQQMTDSFREVFVHLAPQRTILIGHSMTGKLATILAATPPPNLAGVILTAPSPLLPEPMTEQARATMTIANLTPQSAQEFVEGGAHQPLTPQQLQTAIEDVLNTHPEAWKSWPQSGTREDWSMTVRQITLPSLLIVGEYDQAIPLDFQRQHTLPLLTNGTLEVIPNCAHLLPYEAPTQLATLIRAFTKTV